MKVNSYQRFFGMNPGQLEDSDFERLTTYFHLLGKVQKPAVSLVIPVYRAKETLLGHIASLANLKTIIPYEVIFVENNADEDSLSILYQLGAKVVSQPEQGITHARQKGLEEARGTIVCSMDPDTIYDPYYIDHMVLPFFEDEDLVLTYSVSKSYENDFQLSSKMRLRNKLKEVYFRLKMRKGFTSRIKHIRAVCMAVKRDALLPIGYETDLRAVSGCDDGMLAMHLHGKGKFRYIPVDIYTALPPKREPGKPFPYCNERFFDANSSVEQAYKSMAVDRISE